MHTRAASWTAASPVAIVTFAVVLRLPVISRGQIDYDGGVYWQSLRSLAAGHPLFSQVYSSQPPARLLFVFPFYRLSGER
jgi:hypothetical protein